MGPQPESAFHGQTELSGPGDAQRPLAVLSLELVEMKQRLTTAEARIHELERRLETTLDRVPGDAHAGDTARPETSEVPSLEEADRMPSFVSLISELRRTIAERVDDVDDR